MPTAMEQWRAAVGAWNRKLAAMPHSGYYQTLWQGRRSQKYRQCKDFDWRLELLLVLLKTICVGESRFHTQSHGILAGRLSGGGTTLGLLHYCIVALARAFSSLVVRCLLIMAGDVELNPGPAFKMDLAKLLRFLHDVRVKWYDIGIQLNISTGTLDAIRQENQSDCGKCLREMVKDWLNRKYPQATFDALIDALTSEPVGENTLAENTRYLDVAITSEAGGASSETDPEDVIKDMESKDKIYRELKKYMVKCQWTGGVLGQGSFGTVLEMKSGDQLYAGKKYTEIPRSKRQFILKLYGELLILTKINHPNIVKSVGITFGTDCSPIVLMECMKITLQEYLLNKHPNAPVVKKAKLLHDVANGLKFLHNHSPTIIHRDLTATNVLLDEAFSVAKISDFGNARLLDLTSGRTPLTSQPGTLHYMPPEVLEREDYDISLDIFSFGHLMLFTINQEIPGLLGATYADLNGIHGRSEIERRNPYIVKAQKQLGSRHPFIVLMERCLHNVPGKRPSAEVSVETLSHVVQVSHVEDIDIMVLVQQTPKEMQFQAVSSGMSRAPQKMDRGAAVTLNGTAYFTPYGSHVLYKYLVDEDKWTELPLCPQANFGLTIIETLPTAIGGVKGDKDPDHEVVENGHPVNTLISFNGTQWVEKFPPMITARSRPAIVSTCTPDGGTTVIAAGGWGHDGDWWTNVVECYSSTTGCWTRLIDMPLRLPGIAAALCGDQLYLLDWGDSVYTCSLQALIMTSEAVLSIDGEVAQKYLSVWKSVPNAPTLWSTPATVCGKLVVVGGHTRPNPTNAIHMYNGGKWMCIGRMSSARRDSIVAVTCDDKMIVVGGLDPQVTDDVEIISVTCM